MVPTIKYAVLLERISRQQTYDQSGRGCHKTLLTEVPASELKLSHFAQTVALLVGCTQSSGLKEHIRDCKVLYENEKALDRS